ncbi:MAG: hypothetical protein WCO80_00705 [Betaproteobacteria bacterium]|jgi:hypothetical protein
MHMIKNLFSFLAIFASIAHAHDGHGIVSSHWHATDVMGYVLLAVLVGAYLWSQRK